MVPGGHLSGTSWVPVLHLDTKERRRKLHGEENVLFGLYSAKDCDGGQHEVTAPERWKCWLTGFMQSQASSVDQVRNF